MRLCHKTNKQTKTPNSLTAKHKRIYNQRWPFPKHRSYSSGRAASCPDIVQADITSPFWTWARIFFTYSERICGKKKKKTRPKQNKRTQLLKRRYKKYCVQQSNRKPQSGRTISHTSPGETGVQLLQMLPKAGSIVNTLGIFLLFVCF